MLFGLSWFGGTLTGDKFDILLAGPNRPARREVYIPQRKSTSRPKAQTLSTKTVQTVQATETATSSAAKANEALEEREERLLSLDLALESKCLGVWHYSGVSPYNHTQA